MKTIRVFVTGVLSAVLVLTVMAQATFGREWLTEDIIDTGDEALSARVDIDAWGNAVAIFNQLDSDGWHVYANNCWAACDAWIGAVKLSSHEVNEFHQPQIAVDAEGNAIAVFQQSDGEGHNNICARRYEAGSGWDLSGPPRDIDAGMGDDPWEARIAINADGDGMAVFGDIDDEGRERIYARRYVAGPGWDDEAVLIDPEDAYEAHAADIAIDSEGNAIAVFIQGEGLLNFIYANYYRAGSVWLGATPIGDEIGYETANTPTIAIDSYGSAIALFTALNSSDSSFVGVYANRYEAGSVWPAGWTGAEAIDAETAYNARGQAQLAFDEDGNGMAVFNQTDGGTYRIYARYYAIDGGWDFSSPLLPRDAGTGSDASFPHVAFDPDGNAIMVFQQVLPIGFDYRDTVYARYFEFGAGWDEDVEQIDGGGGSENDAMGPHIAIDAGGNAVAVFTQLYEANRRIWATRYAPTGTYAVGSVVRINEVMVNGSGGGANERRREFIELYNTSWDRTVDIGGWMLTDGEETDTIRDYAGTHDLGLSGTEIPPRGYALIVTSDYRGYYNEYLERYVDGNNFIMVRVDNDIGSRLGNLGDSIAIGSDCCCLQLSWTESDNLGDYDGVSWARDRYTPDRWIHSPDPHGSSPAMINYYE